MHIQAQGMFPEIKQVVFDLSMRWGIFGYEDRCQAGQPGPRLEPISETSDFLIVDTPTINVG